MFGFLRLRRFRTPIVLSIFLMLVFYHFSSFKETASKFSIERLREHTALAPPEVPAAPKEDGTTEPQIPEVVLEPAREPIPLPTIAPIEKPSPRLPPTSLSSTIARGPPGEATPSSSLTTSTELERWTPYPEHYPVPSDEIILLPTSKPKAIPQIQASFAPENEAARKVRLERQAAVKEAFLHAWTGYKTYAWGHDELTPVSNRTKESFGGWGATLVDTLDTLWLMGLEDEFKEAVNEVAKIDFRSTTLNTIPLFETVIRYLGGLLAAYDISGQTYSVLLDKALELGDMLYASFDTPNRMPLLRYGWHAEQIAQAKRAPKSASVAEMGSLSMEFTRLAQITGNNSYYDAIARITNALEEYQYETTLPGMWPLYVDSSGCKLHKASHSISSGMPKTTKKPATVFGSEPSDETDKKSKDSGIEEVPFVIPNELGGTGKEVFLEQQSAKKSQPKEPESGVAEHVRTVTNEFGSGKEVFPERLDGHNHQKRDEVFEAKYANGNGAQSTDAQEDEESSHKKPAVAEPNAADDRQPPTAMSSPSRSSRTPPSTTCSPQGLAKPPSLREEKYGLGAMADSLYEYFPKEYLLLGGLSDQYRRMYESSMDVAIENLLFRPNVPGNPDILLAGDYIVKLAGDARFESKSGHLACFAGGMLAIGGRMFGRLEDVTIGSKLTDGCVWAYDIMPSGIMPETFKVVPCEDKESCEYSDETWFEALVPAEDLADSSTPTRAGPGARGGNMKKRVPPSTNGYKPTREEVAFKIIDDEELPQGFLGIGDKRYILRPEAIESVFIMYRVTADKSWQDKGWNMFEAVEKASRTAIAHSAINDITYTMDEEDFGLRDEMESFWLAETLKYYYLLFSEPDLMSLDDYVLNTEAHPFKRPTVA